MITAQITISDALDGTVKVEDMTIKNGKIESLACYYLDVSPCYSCSHIPSDEYSKLHILTPDSPFDWTVENLSVVGLSK